MNGLWDAVQNAIVGFSFCWIVWVIFSSVRRYLIAKAKAGLQERILQRIDSSDSLVTLANSDSGRRFLESLAVEEMQPNAPYSRILFGIQAGVVLLFFGIAMLFLHRHVYDAQSGFIITGTGAVGIGVGFLIASATSIFVSRRLGLLDHERRG
jgi:hypothetical protein